MSVRSIRLVPILLAVALTGALVPMNGAAAAPVDDKRAQAAQLQAQIDENGRKIDALSEQANGARYRREQAQAARDDAQSRIDTARAERARLRALLGERALDVYKGAGTTSPLDAIEVDDAREFAARSKYAAAASNTQNKLVAQLRGAEEELAARQLELDAAIEQAKTEQQQIEASRDEIESANAHQAQLLDSVEGELATLVAREQQRREAEAAARARALTTPRPAATNVSSSGSGGSSSSSGGGGGNWSGPAASGGAGAAIAFARSQLGKPYVYAATGPDSYDCSGLTMRAWQAGGVSMPHYSGAQYDMFPHVPLDALQPGDLVFWGPGGSNHVAMYTGGGNVIYAPQTGDVVKEGPIYGSPSGAARPG